MTASNSALVVAVFALALPSLARADPPAAPPTEAQVETARALYHEARDLERAGKLSEALEKALAAYRTAATPVTAVEAGQILVALGRFVEARDLVREVSLLPVSPRESDKGKEARQQAAALAASLDGRIPKIALASRAPGVPVLLDGKPLATVDPSAWLGVDPGSHALAVLVDGKPCTTISVTLAEGEERTIDLHDATNACRREPAPVAPPAPVTPTSPPPASAAAPEPAPRATEPPPSGSAPWSATRWIGVAIAGAGVVAIGVGGELALNAKSQYDSVASACPAAGCSPYGFDTRNDARSRGDAASIVMGLGAATLIGGVVVWALAPSSATNVGVSSRGIELRARW